MIRAENRGESTEVEITGFGGDIIMEYYHIIHELMTMLKAQTPEALSAFLDVTLDAVTEALGEGEEDGESEADDIGASYEVRFDNFS